MIDAAALSQRLVPPSISRKIIRVAMKTVAGLVAFLVIGNLLIFSATMWARGSTAILPVPSLEGVGNLREVDGDLWRGALPTSTGYAELADSGVKTIINLRAETTPVDVDYIDSLGMQLVRIPMRDGQAPSPEQIDKFLTAVRTSPGLAYVHCGAGVGRTGTMAATYLVETGQAEWATSLRRNLAVGPPSLEQIAFVAGLGDSEAERPNFFVTAISRVLDAPRRLMARV